MKNAHGFTLTELLVTLAIAALLIAMGIPSFQSLLQRLALENAEQDIVELARLARATAVTESAGTVLCGSSDGMHCDGETDWQHALIAFQDLDDNHQRDDSDPLLHVNLLDDAHFEGTGSKLEFNPSGGGYMGSWVYCSDDLPASGNTFKLVVSLGGRIRVDTESVGRCT